ncbi:type I phosphomannose isomerase catalytic subunit [Flavobacterium pallidum]|uniref:Phosphohexomutase n=1 Tax=Flavobacterium pallidum TaxID=2172098 RepID=A0A2S1SH28_9FLAO|nr:type I phosphomannose isomerase catalytic subunit [Flavobacterium pallidum]AWI25700.1 mannose-6-phosphate isomerase [Flavobacterium pallidum]
MKPSLYPMQFEPILKERIWGGRKLKTLLHKPITSEITGESWELSTVKGDISIVANGEYKGKPLTEVIASAPQEILGMGVHKRFGNEFPLLFKYLDAREDLSIQVHPNDELAKKRHNSFGKTEMWYVMQADPDSRIIVGFKGKSSPQQYLDSLKDKSIVSLLDTIKAKPGDVFFLETGTVHAIGAGLVIAEIQQTSDITYRIYDFERKDASGNPRQLHVEEALEAINYNPVDAQKHYSKITNESNTLVDCQYFTTNLIPLEGKKEIHQDGNSFRVFMCTQGNFSLATGRKKFEYKTGDTVLVPAGLTDYALEGTASVLEIYIS